MMISLPLYIALLNSDIHEFNDNLYNVKLLSFVVEAIVA